MLKTLKFILDYTQNRWLFYKDLTRKRLGPKCLSALARCLLQSIPALHRFYCIHLSEYGAPHSNTEKSRFLLPLQFLHWKQGYAQFKNITACCVLQTAFASLHQSWPSFTSRGCPHVQTFSSLTEKSFCIYSESSITLISCIRSVDFNELLGI